MTDISSVKPDHIYTDPEAQKITGLSRHTLWRYRQRGLLAYLKPMDGGPIRYRGQHLLDFFRAAERGGVAA